MKRLLPLLLALLLSGCHWNREQQFSACAVEAGRQPRKEVPADFPPPGGEYVEACMRTHGYALNQDQCPGLLRDDVIKRELDPAGMAALSENHRKAYTEGLEKRLAVLAAWRKADPACYEPTGWFGKQ